MSTLTESLSELARYDWADNEPGAIEKLRDLNEFYRRVPHPCVLCKGGRQHRRHRILGK
jgi:hypothetical protein